MAEYATGVGSFQSLTQKPTSWRATRWRAAWRRGPDTVRNLRQRTEVTDAALEARFFIEIGTKPSSPSSIVRVFCSGSRSSLVERRQLCAVIGDKDREQARRLSNAAVLADEMFAAGWLEEALAGFVDFDRSSRGTLGLDRTRKHEDEDASCVVMLDRLSARGVGAGEGADRGD